MKKPPLVTEDEFKKLECNRCGECCQRFVMGGVTPDDLAKEIAAGSYRDPDPDVIDANEWLAALVATQDPDGVWVYACPFYSVDAGDGLPGCTIYERRPTGCRDLPYGRPMPDWSSCVWNVRIRKATRVSKRREPDTLGA